jgi:hypothetical protein
MPDARAGDAYSRLIDDQVNQERDRKASLESRGVTVVTTSSALATLLFALTAGLTTAASFKLPGSAKLPLILALATFVLAAVLGLATNIPLRYRGPTAEALGNLCNPNYWDGAAALGQRRVAEAQVRGLQYARDANAYKVVLLLSAIGCELAAAGILAWAIGEIIYGS